MFQSSSAPPRIWPATPPTPTVRPNQDSALERSSTGKIAAITASTWGTIIAAVAPWRRRAMTSWVGLSARPHRSDATANALMPPTNSLRWP